MMYQQHMQPNMPEADMAYAVLSDLKRVVREYATAATESSCPAVRGMFTNLLSSSLKMQGDLYNAMQQQNMYNTASPALRQELDKQYKQYQQDLQKTNQYLQQTLGGQQQQLYGQQAHHYAPQSQQQPYYNGQQQYNQNQSSPFYM